ncbi:S-adenosyl-L-methionine-dependent methyltransferase, partial [Lizonia empirigonia]
DTAAFRCASEMELFQRIPLTLGRTASSADLAAAVGVEAKVLTRILRLLCVHNCFQEVESNVFAHTRFSAFVQEHPHFMSFTRTSLEVFGASSTSLPDALLAPPGPKGLRPSAFEVRFGEGCYAWWNKHPDKLARFQHGLHEPLLLNEIKDSDDWDDVQGTVVDVGGGEGQVAMCLVESFPHLEFVVQDIFITPDVVDKVALGRQANRLRFEVHDYFTPQQPMEGGTFFLKHCLHNNSDVDCVRILKAIALALGQSGLGTRLIVAENVLPEWDDLSVSRQQRLELLQDDISMLQLFNAKKRTALQYQELLAQADPRLKMVGIH